MTRSLLAVVSFSRTGSAGVSGNAKNKKGPAVVFAGLFCSLALAASASAASPSPGWMIESHAAPTSFSANDNAGCPPTVGNQSPVCDSYEVTARNQGSVATSEGVEVSLSDTLPAGVTAQGERLIWPSLARTLGLESEENLFPIFESLKGTGFGECSAAGSSINCSVVFSKLKEVGFCSGAGCSVAPDEEIRLTSYVTVDEPVPRPVQNAAAISGGGAPAAQTETTNQIGEPPGFGPSSFGFYAAAADGTRDTQAAEHPSELTVTIGLNTKMRAGPDEQFEPESVQDVRDVVTDLPVGFVGSILAAPQCTFTELASHIVAGEGGCPRNTIVGHIRTEPAYLASVNGPIYNMTPERGVPAEFAYVDSLAGPHVFYSRVVPTAKGYVLQTTNPEIPAIRLKLIVVNFYGDPERHDAETQAKQLEEESGKHVEPEVTHAPPFFTNPANCEGERPTATIYMDSWQHPARFNQDGTPANVEEGAWKKTESSSPAVTGCNALQFTPELLTKPTTEAADTPSGMEVALSVPQSQTMGVPATPALKDASVTFPEGFTLDPSAGDGLEACSEAQIGWLGANGPGGEPLPNRGLTNFSPAPPACPKGSKVGAIELTTPLISGTLHGEMYLANQNENPYGSEIGLYVVVQDPVTGVLIKIAGRTLSDPLTGQVTGVFEENPNLPFNELKLSFFGGPRAEFATPNDCGMFTSTSDLRPWSLEGAELPASPFSSFPIATGCVNGFNPAFTGSSLNLQAGAYSPFVASFSREDTDHELGGVSLTLPPGLLANVGSVPLCGEAQANAGTGVGGCPENTQVGTVLAEAGPGPNPLPNTGRVYLTGPYKGGPYGLSVVVPAIVGNPAHPTFNFGLVVVRQSLRIDPHTAQVTDVSDPFPTMLHATGAGGETIGIPIRLRRVQVEINRSGFTFNPTNCGKLKMAGSITSTQDESRALETPFQVTDCEKLKFTPKFSVSTSGKTSKSNGASLTAKLTEPGEPQGSQANIAKVKVELPKALPSRLTTLQKACLDKVFEANPAACPPASRIGFATVHTPILPGVAGGGSGGNLIGPAIFVSHGGEAFPSLTMVLQGDNVTVELVGTTFISKAGITSTTFKTVPDTPFSTFELTLPQGRFSALGANLPARAHGSFCGQNLKMPTEFVAQNGAVIHQTTKIAVTGCKKPKKPHRFKRHTKDKAKRRKKK